MSWGGDFSYNSGVPGQWTWTAGATGYGMSLGISYQANPKASYGSANSVFEGYRYLGWFKSQYNWFGGHEFSALLKLHLINDAAIDWANGIWEEVGLTERITKINKIRVALNFGFYVYSFPKWFLFGAHEHIMGDGAPSTDLNYIPLLVGSAP